MSTDFFNHFAITFDSFYDGKRNKMMQILDRKFRKDIFERFAITFNNLDELNNRTIIDIGCGSGVYMFEALKKGAKFVTGVDPAKGMLDLAAKRLSAENDFLGRYNLILGNFPDIEVDRYDFAIVMGVMDYIKNPVGFLKKLKEKITVSAFISFPSIHWFRTPLRKIRYRIRSCPVYFFDEIKIRDLANQSGLSKINITKINGPGLDFYVRIDNE